MLAQDKGACPHFQIAAEMTSQQQGEDGLPEWIMSYADMITILMAFFVVMYSMAGEKNQPKEEAVMESLRNWLGPVRAMRSHDRDLQRIPSREVAAEGVDHRGPSGSANWRVVRSLGGSVYFDQNETALTSHQQEQLQRAADLLIGKRQLVEVHGVPGARWAAAAEPGEQLDEVWSKCRLVAEHLVTLGIERPRLQIHISSPAAEPQDRNLLRDQRDFRIDVNLSDRFLREP